MLGAESYIPKQYDVLCKDQCTINTSLTEGFQPLCLTDQIRHPIGDMATNAPMKNEFQSLRTSAALYGMHAPFCLARERILTSQNRRLPPLKSSMLSLEVLLDKDHDIDFDDYLNVENPEPRFRNLTGHQLMEKRLGYDI